MPRFSSADCYLLPPTDWVANTSLFHCQNLASQFSAPLNCIFDNEICLV